MGNDLAAVFRAADLGFLGSWKINQDAASYKEIKLEVVSKLR
jgi:hypothetical protein